MGVFSGFNTQPPEGGWAAPNQCAAIGFWFQHTAARRRLDFFSFNTQPNGLFQHTAARRRLVVLSADVCILPHVSTHSRPKAAGHVAVEKWLKGGGFNTQPPEGGWTPALPHWVPMRGFNTQPPEGGWLLIRYRDEITPTFQHTAARRRLAPENWRCCVSLIWFQHTAARRRLGGLIRWLV